MTNTTTTNGQSIGTSTNIGPDKFPTKTTIQSTTTSFVVSAQITNGASANPSDTLRVWYASTPFTYASAAAGLVALRQTAQPLDIRLSPVSSGVYEKISPLTTVNGADVYIWCEVPKLPAGVPATLSIKLLELP